MADSHFYPLLCVKDKFASNSLVYRFLECYNVNNKTFIVKDKIIHFDITDIARVTRLRESGDASTP